MLHSHVERDGSGLHISYYDTDHHKEGSMELTFVNPSDQSRIHDGDRIQILNLVEAAPAEPVTVHIDHPDGSSDDIPCSHT